MAGGVDARSTVSVHPVELIEAVNKGGQLWIAKSDSRELDNRLPKAAFGLQLIALAGRTGKQSDNAGSRLLL